MHELKEKLINKIFLISDAFKTKLDKNMKKNE